MLPHHVREAPDVAEADRRSGHGENDGSPAAEAFSFLFHILLLTNCIPKRNAYAWRFLYTTNSNSYPVASSKWVSDTETFSQYSSSITGKKASASGMVVWTWVM